MFCLISGSFLFRIISNLVGVILSSGLDRCLMATSVNMNLNNNQFKTLTITSAMCVLIHAMWSLEIKV
jgi:hypothetical protein